MTRFPVPRTLKVDELIKQYEDIIPQVDEDLRQISVSDHLPLPEAPHEFEVGGNGAVEFADNGDPIVPKDLTDLDSVQLGKLFSFMTGWANYVQSEETRAKCQLLVQKRYRTVIESALTVYYKEDQGVASHLVDSMVNTDSRFVEIDSAVLRTEVIAKKTETRLEQLTRSLKLISREQTRRGEDLDRINHESHTAPQPRWRRPGR